MKKFKTNTKILTLLVALLFVANIPMPYAAAQLSEDQKKRLNSGVVDYDPESLSSCSNSDNYSGESVENLSSDSSIYASNLEPPYILEQWAIHTLKALAQKTSQSDENFVTEEHVLALVAFALGEGGDINNTSSVFNPLNTGLNAPELLSTPNAANGTQSFKSFDAGVEGTARTMLGSNQNRLAEVLSKKNSTAQDFMETLTYYQRFRGNAFWAAQSLPPNQDSYFRERLSLINTVKNDYANIASYVIGTDELEQPRGIRDPSKLQFNINSGTSEPVDTDGEVSSDCRCSLPGDSHAKALAGENNRLKAFNFFTEKGATPVQAAGIVGNFMQESTPELDPNASNGTHEGIAQWGGGRWQNLLTFANKAEFREQGARDLLVQLEFAWQEEEMKTYLRENPTTPEQAADLFEEIFERSGGSEMQKRRDYAKQIYEEAGSPADQTADNSTANCNDSGSSQQVNAEGYALPIRKEGVNLPCNDTTCHHDGTPAADLFRPDGDPVYAIVSGRIDNFSYRSGFGRNGPAPSECQQLQLVGDDGWVYWYGHIKGVSVDNGDTVEAGQQIAVVGQSRCADDTPPHLHIDRGSPKGEYGGRECCRDPAFVELLNEIYENTD